MHDVKCIRLDTGEVLIGFVTKHYNGDYTIQERNIIDYDGSLRTAQVDIPWDKNKFPKDPRTTPIDYTNYTLYFIDYRMEKNK